MLRSTRRLPTRRSRPVALRPQRATFPRGPAPEARSGRACGVVWVVERVREAAEDEYYDPAP
ncbi:hypothetical protein ABZ070_17050, partial [Streptomyces sp. NPDC006283]